LLVMIFLIYSINSLAWCVSGQAGMGVATVTGKKNKKQNNNNKPQNNNNKD